MSFVLARLRGAIPQRSVVLCGITERLMKLYRKFYCPSSLFHILTTLKLETVLGRIEVRLGQQQSCCAALSAHFFLHFFSKLHLVWQSQATVVVKLKLKLSYLPFKSCLVT